MSIENMDDLKQKLRRAAAYLQGSDTRYFNDAARLEAITILYRIADGLAGVTIASDMDVFMDEQLSAAINKLDETLIRDRVEEFIRAFQGGRYIEFPEEIKHLIIITNEDTVTLDTTEYNAYIIEAFYRGQKSPAPPAAIGV